MLSLAFFIVLLSASFAKDISSSSSTELSTDYILRPSINEFYDLLEKNRTEIIFTRFYLPSCPACIAFESGWKKVAKALQGVCKVVDYNCRKDPNTCWYVGIEYFPEFVVFINNRVYAIFDDDYGVRRLIDFIKDKEYEEEEYRRKAKRKWQ
ncbi:hypothetical protein ACKWTF_006790 [Chironomus riparius]